MNKKILFVDDEINVLHGYRRNLRSLFDVHIANSGSEALKIIAEQGDFAVIISDYRMPEMDGIELLHKVKEISPDTIRIILTGFADMQIAIEAINEGNIFRFLTKPLPTDKGSSQQKKNSPESFKKPTTQSEKTLKLPPNCNASFFRKIMFHSAIADLTGYLCQVCLFRATHLIFSP